MANTQSSNGMRKGNTSEITAAPTLADIDITSTFSILANTDDTSLRQVFPANAIPDNELQAAIDYRNVFKQGDVITAFTKFYDLLTTTYIKQADFSLDTVLYWFYRIKRSDKELASFISQSQFHQDNVFPILDPANAQFTKNALTSNGSDPENQYFDNISDSIGIMANSKYMQLDSTLPLFDVNQEYYGVPVPFSASTENKISANTRNVMYDLSKKTTTLMRRNLLNIGYSNTVLLQNLAADASTSHGLNLINDLPTFVNINQALLTLIIALYSIYTESKLFGFVQYLCNIGNSTGFNLRDIFPVSSSDKDFVVITSQERAQQSQAIAKSEVAEGLANQALAAQQQVMGLADSANYNSQIGKRPYAPTDNITLKPTFAAPLAGSGTPMNQNGAGTSLRLSDVESTGNVTEKAVSTYGGQMSDLSTYFDTKPDQRDPDATAFYLQKYGADKLQRLDDNYRTGDTTAASWGTLTSAEQAQGAYVGNNLTPAFDVGIGRGDYPPRTLLRITNAETGQPIDAGGANPDGIYRVGDTGSSANLRKVGRDSGVSTGALDFYAGNNPQLTSYYDKLNGSGVKLRVEVVKSKV